MSVVVAAGLEEFDVLLAAVVLRSPLASDAWEFAFAVPTGSPGQKAGEITVPSPSQS
ncbi:hypothetical protein [Streptomyces sp. Je 1-332]|uniref:hypothetical protein n=1 Tax=Streptomyces sp. Je 1-332 TaxID=3231270 RepID=UPI003457C533